MHVLVIPSYYPNSYNPIDGIYFKVQAEELAKIGIQVGIIAPIIIKHYVLLREKKIDYGSKQPADQLPTYIYQLPSFPLFKWMNDLMRLHYGKKLFKKYVKTHGKPDIIHLHSFENGILTRWIEKNYGIPYLITEHSTCFARNEYSLRVIELAKKTFNQAKKTIVVSSDLQSVLQQKFALNPKIIPNLINSDFFISQSTTKAYDFVTVGGLREVKNYKLLINAFSKLEDVQNKSLVIIGVGPQKEELKNLVGSLGLDEQITFAGPKSPEEIVTLFNQSKVFVSSSTVETFGVAIIEAMSCGMPVVCTKSGGPEYFVTDKSLGELCDHTVESLNKSMHSVLQSALNYDSEHIRKHITSQFSGKVVANKLLVEYKSVLKSSAE